jgi:hypothetical protein
MTVTEQKLDELHFLRNEIAALEAGTPDKLKLELGEEAYATLVRVQAELNAYKSDLQAKAAKLEADIKRIVEREGKTFAGQFLQAVWSRGKLLFNRDLLEHEMKKDKVFAKKMQEFYEEGNPSVSFRAVGKKQ